MPVIVIPPKIMSKVYRAQKRMTELLSELDKCESCGMETSALKQQTKEMLAVLQQIDKEFGQQTSAPTTLPPYMVGGLGGLPEQ